MTTTTFKNLFNSNGLSGPVMAFWCLVWMMSTGFVFSQDTCSCSPLVYRWTLDFSNICNFSSQGNPNGNIGISVGPQGEAVESATCSVKIENPTSPVTERSLQPVLVKGFQFIELGDNLQRIKVMSTPSNFQPLLDGGVLEFTSAAASGMEMPTALIAFVFAENADGDDIQLEWLIRFSTLCDVVPFQVGDSLGWLRFSGVTNARDETCKSVYNFPSAAPSSNTAAPTSTPTTSPTPLPSKTVATAIPTASPSKIPLTASPTMFTEQKSPTKAPALAQPDLDTGVVRPTSSPTTSPTTLRPMKNTSSTAPSSSRKSPKGSKSEKSASSVKKPKKSNKSSKSQKSQSSGKKSKKSKKGGKSEKSQSNDEKWTKSPKSSKSGKHTKVKVSKTKKAHGPNNKNNNMRSLRGSNHQGQLR
mmetsp:Transcript_12580/g.23589  ORF Transcript_12580/g.23589 Transcript_12580/m.23589 type:complete len:416 (+) Transcript_12580:422-1669(+)